MLYHCIKINMLMKVRNLVNQHAFVSKIEHAISCKEIALAVLLDIESASFDNWSTNLIFSKLVSIDVERTIVIDNKMLSRLPCVGL